MDNLSGVLKQKKVVIFDLDGTLVDSLNIWDDVDREIIRIGGKIPRKNINLEKIEVLNKYSENKTANPYYEYEKYLAESYELTLTVQEVSKLRKDLGIEFVTKRVKMRKNADLFLKFLKAKKYTLGVATLSSKYIYKIYADENVNVRRICDFNTIFDKNVITADMVLFKKPNPEVYLKMQEKLGVEDKSEIVIIEDSLQGVMAANAAGIDAICIKEDKSLRDAEELKERSIYYAYSYIEIFNLFRNLS